MADIGDVHAQLVAAAVQEPRAHRVVEVARVGRVDGQRELVAQVAAERVGSQRAVDVERQTLGLRERGGRKRRREPIRRDHGLHAQVELLGAAEPRVDRHDAGAAPVGVLQDMHAHDVARPHAAARRARILGQHKEVVAQAGVERPDHAQRIGHVVGTDEIRCGTHDHITHDRHQLGPAAPHERHADLVAVHGLAQPAARDGKDALCGLDRGTSLARHAQRPLHDRGRLACAPLIARAVRPSFSHASPPIRQSVRPHTSRPGTAYVRLHKKGRHDLCRTARTVPSMYPA